MQKSLVLQLFRFFIVICGFVTVGGIFIYLFKFIYPLLIAFIISAIMYPFIRFLENKARLPRFISILITMTGLFLLLFGLLLLIITEVYQSSLFLADQIPKHFHSFVLFLESIFNNHLFPLYERLISYFHSLSSEQQVTITGYIRTLTDFVASSGAELLRSTLVKIPAVLAVIPGSLTTITFILLAIFMISNDYENLKGIIRRVIPEKAERSLRMLISHFRLAINGFLKAQFTLIFISACIILTGLLILQVEHALTITLFAAVVDFIPYIGTGVLFIPWILYLYAMADYQLTIGLSIIYMIVIITRQILEPRILSTNIGIHPLIILTGMFVGIQLWGFAGLLIVPIVIVLGNACHQSGILQIIWQFIRG